MTAQSLPSAETDFSRGAGPAGPLGARFNLSRVDLAVLGGLALLSVGLLFWATGNVVLAAGFLAGLAIAVGGVCSPPQPQVKPRCPTGRCCASQ